MSSALNTVPATLMETWRRALTGDNSSDPREVVIAELSAYFKLDPDEVRHRCVYWEDYSVKEWATKDRTTPEGLIEFYKTQVSWIFDTMWYHAGQYHGENVAQSVAVAEGLKHVTPGHHLDFGAGPGSSSLFFHELGWQVSLADISTTMLDYARWRLQRHNVSANFYELPQDKLPDQTFDLITAFDVIAHVPNSNETIQQLRRILKPNGYLIFNIDARPKGPTTECHLYEAHYPILRSVRALGFKRCPRISDFYVFQKTEYSQLPAKVYQVADELRYNPYTSFVGRQMRQAQQYLQRVGQ